MEPLSLTPLSFTIIVNHYGDRSKGNGTAELLERTHLDNTYDWGIIGRNGTEAATPRGRGSDIAATEANGDGEKHDGGRAPETSGGLLGGMFGNYF